MLVEEKTAVEDFGGDQYYRGTVSSRMCVRKEQRGIIDGNAT